MAHATDDFNRTGPGLGANWTVARGDMVIDSNRVRGNATNDSMAYWAAATFGAAQYAQITYLGPSGDGWVGVALRATDGNNYYAYYTNGSHYEIIRYHSGGYTLLEHISHTFAVGDVLRFEASGSTLRALKNGQVITTITDSALTGGAPGIAYWIHALPATATGDNWEGGDLCRPPAPAIQTPAPAVTRWPAVVWISAPRPFTTPPQTRAGPQPLIAISLTPAPIAPSQWLEAPRVLAPSPSTLHAAPRIAGQDIIARPASAPSLLITRGRANIAQPATHITALLTADQITASVEPDT